MSKETRVSMSLEEKHNLHRQFYGAEAVQKIFPDFVRFLSDIPLESFAVVKQETMTTVVELFSKQLYSAIKLCVDRGECVELFRHKGESYYLTNETGFYYFLFGELENIESFDSPEAFIACQFEVWQLLLVALRQHREEKQQAFIEVVAFAQKKLRQLEPDTKGKEEGCVVSS